MVDQYFRVGIQRARPKTRKQACVFSFVMIHFLLNCTVANNASSVACSILILLTESIMFYVLQLTFNFLITGALAMESLHRQVLPFLLRRLKDDVLQDLPPKIIQDYYCDLSPLQVCCLNVSVNVWNVTLVDSSPNKVFTLEIQQKANWCGWASAWLCIICNHMPLWYKIISLVSVNLVVANNVRTLPEIVLPCVYGTRTVLQRSEWSPVRMWQTAANSWKVHALNRFVALIVKNSDISVRNDRNTCLRLWIWWGVCYQQRFSK